MRNPQDVLVITRRDVARVMTRTDFLNAAEEAFRAAATGNRNSPQPMHLPTPRGGFHAKGASISLERDYVAVKINGNFPGNRAEFGLPTVQGVIVLADGSNGALLAILDSIEVTLQRTAAASALAARLLARPNSQTLLVCGCGDQGRAHVAMLREVLPFQRCLLWDGDPEAAEKLVSDLGGGETSIRVVHDLKAASMSADVIVCCTTAKEPYLDVDFVRPGTFVAAVGADNHDKSEITPQLMAAATVISDVLQQCATMGDLHHAIAAGCMTQADVHAELGEVLVGAKCGRRSPDEIIIFDSTGSGLQDVAAAAAIYKRCGTNGPVQSVALADTKEMTAGAGR